MLELESKAEDPLQCQKCGSPVSRRFCRVLGDNQDEVYGCLECTTMRDLARGRAARE